jgi:hypothetical protein
MIKNIKSNAKKLKIFIYYLTIKYSMNNQSLIKRIISYLKPNAIIDGENFKYIPKVKRIDFLGEKSESHNIIMVSKTQSILKQYQMFPFYNQINLCTILTEYRCNNSVDDAFCIALSDSLYKMNLNVILYSNDKYKDIKNIFSQKDALVEYKTEYYRFSPKQYFNCSKIQISNNFSSLPIQ